MVSEAETVPLRAFLAEREGDRLVTSALVRTELRRAVLRFGERADVTHEQMQEAAQEVTGLLGRLDLVRLGSAILDRAGMQHPPQLRSLDSIHLATALRLGPKLHSVVVYDRRLGEAARSAGLPVAAPGEPPKPE